MSKNCDLELKIKNYIFYTNTYFSTLASGDQTYFKNLIIYNLKYNPINFLKTNLTILLQKIFIFKFKFQISDFLI